MKGIIIKNRKDAQNYLVNQFAPTESDHIEPVEPCWVVAYMQEIS